ncbi:hypothetical protein RCL_jg15427.t1 [Rhizophagus clarus]|uniref:Uncharacterized protein n=1 Tax=Rhizophagus clarus TaxID=94130 RepID=A0A8H3KSS7_9GLOM|nr:hypothetical protein RCL_jg15427.t1 [Rhizophagus clarus]
MDRVYLNFAYDLFHILIRSILGFSSAGCKDLFDSKDKDFIQVICITFGIFLHAFFFVLAFSENSKENHADLLFAFKQIFSVDQVEHRWARVEPFEQSKRFRVRTCSSKKKFTIEDKSKFMTEANGKYSATVSKRKTSNIRRKDQRM